jgi:predicted AAA+ superfamily ATPase
MIKRTYDNIEDLLRPGRVLVIYGPRRVGKTTLVQGYLDRTDLRYRSDIGDDVRIQNVLGSRDASAILEHVEGLELYVIDEAQMVPNIGSGLKIIADQRPDLRVIATGSSSFDLAQNIGEPLVGRKKTVTLYPLSQQELLPEYANRAELKEHLEDFLIFGSYPGVVTASTREEKLEYLDELVGSYLLRDILALEQIKSSATLVNLLRLLAFQVGSEISLNEIGSQLSINVRTVQRYLDLLEKSFVIMRLGSFSRNLRSEIAQKSKYYFLDNGVRNGVISQFNGLELRNDIGQLWENFIFTERLKYRAYTSLHRQSYFWRTYSQQEIDFVEEGDGELNAYEVKWSSNARVSAPQDWTATYPEATFNVINRDNYLEFVVGSNELKAPKHD